MGRLNEGQGNGTSGGGPMKPGDTRIIEARDKSGNLLKTYTLYRSDREYVYDLCDAYNAERTPAERARGIEWFVNAGGELRLGDNAAWSRTNLKKIEARTETERSRYLRHQFEREPAE